MILRDSFLAVYLSKAMIAVAAIAGAAYFFMSRQTDSASARNTPSGPTALDHLRARRAVQPRGPRRAPDPERFQAPLAERQQVPWTNEDLFDPGFWRGTP